MFITGQLATDPDDDSLPIPDGLEAQTHKVLDNLRRVLTGLGAGLEHVVCVRVFLTEFNRDYAAFNAIYQSYFAAGQLPALVHNGRRDRPMARAAASSKST